MDKKELIKQGIAEAKKEAQEKEVAFIKGVAKRYLEDIQDYKRKEEDIKSKKKILESELTDLKSGRLDKIKERQDKDHRCKEISPIIIVIINNNHPLKPWLNEYSINWRDNTSQITTAGYVSNSGSLASRVYDTPSNCNLVLTGTVTGSICQVMAAGAYDIDGKIINL